MLPKLQELASAFPKIVRDGPARRSSSGTAPRWRSCPSCSAGPRTPAATSPFPWYSPRIPRRVSATAGPTGCRSSTSAPLACTGTSTRAPRPTTARPSGWPPHRGGVAIGADPAVCFAGTLPLPEALTRCWSPATSGNDRSSWSGARRWTSRSGRCRDRPRRLRGRRRAAARGPVRGPHRLLFPGRRLPGVPPHLPQPSQVARVPHHHRRTPPMEDCHMAAAIEQLFLR